MSEKSSLSDKDKNSVLLNQENVDKHHTPDVLLNKTSVDFIDDSSDALSDPKHKFTVANTQELPPVTSDMSFKQKFLDSVNKFFSPTSSGHEKKQFKNFDLNVELHDPETAYSNLIKLIEIAINHPSFLQTEGILRLSSNEVNKRSVLRDLPSFFESTEEQEPALLASLIKDQLSASLTQKQKMNFCFLTGLQSTEIENKYLTTKREKYLKELLKQQPPEMPNNLPQLAKLIDLCKKIDAQSDINKMTAYNISTCIGSRILPSFVGPRIFSFEKRVNDLINIMLTSWIKNK